MAKGKFTIDITKPIPEWGLSEAVSTAVPIAVSGAEIKSTRSISEAMHNKIRAKIDLGTIKQARSFMTSSKTGKHSKTVFKVGNRARTAVLFRKAK